MKFRVQPSRLSGEILIPPSKSHTLRAILFASLAEGTSTIRRYLPSPDTLAMIQACELLGATIRISPDTLYIQGCRGHLKAPKQIIDAGNSGQVLRFIAALTALLDTPICITGDHSIRTRRPLQPLMDGLTGLQVTALSMHNHGYAPLWIKGPLQGGETRLHGEDSQPVSGLLIAAAFAQAPITIHVDAPGEKPWIDLTLDWFERLGIPFQRQGYTFYQLEGQACYPGFDYEVPGDFSSCAFPLIGALITHSNLTLQGLDMQDVQGDKALIFALQEMGANIGFDAEKNSLHISHSSPLQGQTLDVNVFIDALPILAVLACFIQGTTILKGAAIARQKESDRLTVITAALQKMGANIIEEYDGLIIQPSSLTGTTLHSYDDHRIAMALVIAGLGAKGETIIQNCQCVEKSFPNFVHVLKSIGANVDVFA